MKKKGIYNSIPRNGLVGEWLLDGSAIDTNDGTKTNGTATNVTYTNTSIGYQKQVGVFNGSSAYVAVGKPFNNYTSGSVSIRFTHTNNTGNFILYSFRGSSQNLVREGQFDINNGVLRMVIDKGGASYDVLSQTGTLTVGKKYEVTFVWNTTTKYIYIDGIYNNELASTVAVFNSSVTNNYNIGRNNSGTGSSYWNGNLQSVRVYNRALSTSEITNLYYEGLRKLGGGSDTIMNDCSFYADFNGDANDVVGGFTPTLTGSPTIGTDNFGLARGYTFGSSGNHAKSVAYTGFNTALTTGYTFELKFKLNTLIAGGNALFDVRTLNTAWFNGVISSTYFRISVNSSANQDYTANLNTGQLYHFALSVTSAGVVLGYLDGVQRWSFTKTAAGAGTYGMYLGNNVVNTSGLACDIAYARFFNSAKSADQCKELYTLSQTKYLYPIKKTLPPNLKDGLQLWLAGDNASGTYYDASGNGNNTNSVTAFTNSRNQQNKVISLNGTSSVATIPDSTSLRLNGTSFSYAIWFKGTDADGILFTKRDLTDVEYFVYSGGSDTFRVMQWIVSGGTTATAQLNADAYNKFMDGKWHLLSFSHTYGQTVSKAYIDGKEFALSWTNQTASAVTPSTRSLYIGKNGTGATSYLVGSIGDLLLYNRFLSPVEHQQLFYSLFKM